MNAGPCSSCGRPAGPRLNKFFYDLPLEVLYIKLMIMKKTSGADTLKSYAQRLKVCGHGLRLQILFVIEKGESACVKELWKCLRQVQPVISQHLAVLKESGIVSCETSRNKRIYKIVDPFVKEMIRTIGRDTSVKNAFLALEE
jgi:ArsR family transcriptional regulator